MSNRLALALLAAWLPAMPLAAQEERTLTDQAGAALAAFYNAPETVRLTGETRIPGGTTVEADVASLGGPLRVGGTIRGSVVVINGDLHLDPGARITGTATVVGGALLGGGPDVARTLIVYPEPLGFRWEGDRMVALGAASESWLTAGLPTRFGRVDVALAVDGSYNRVEGLPIAFGPRFSFGQTNPTIVDLRLVYRTGSGLRIHPDELGHQLRVEQYLGGHRSVRIGLGRHRVIDPIEQTGLSDTENSLATFIMHRDYRDHYSRRGWSAYLLYGGRTRPLDAGVEYRDETHGSVMPANPWSLLDNDEDWRLQPQVAEGDLQTVRGWLLWDTRNQRVDPAAGWLVRVDVEQGLEGELRVAAPSSEDDTRPVKAEFTAVQLDARRYLRLGPRTRVALRGRFAGSPDDGELPPQRQHVLGGEGSLPGYEPFAFDCGARSADPESGYPYYGCDRSVLFQAEARFTLFETSRFSLGRQLGLDFDLVTTPELVLFADAGRAWIERESLDDRLALGRSTFQFDLGAGLRLGRLGAYLAVPLSGDEDGVNFFVRLGPRF